VKTLRGPLTPLSERRIIEEDDDSQGQDNLKIQNQKILARADTHRKVHFSLTSPP
jgi:hypothetical protein